MKEEAIGTVKFAIMNGIAETGNKYVRPGVDCAGLVDAILKELTDKHLIWALKELAN